MTNLEALNIYQSYVEAWKPISGAKRKSILSEVFDDNVEYLVPEYVGGTWTNHTPRRIRKLLLHRKEIDRLASKIAEQGLTLVPLSLYFRDGNVKVELGLARGKRTYDKRQALAKRDAAREVDRALKRRR